MSQASSTHRKQVERSILKSAKKVITESGIDPSTRSGNKELDYVVKLLAKQCVGSLAAATQMGNELGQRIVSLSQAMERTHLDQGVLRQLRLQKDFFTGVGKSEENNTDEEGEEKHGIATVTHSTEEAIEDEEGKELEEGGKENEAMIDLVEQDNDEDGDNEDEKAIDLIDEDENEDENEDEEIRNEITIDLVEEEDKQEEEAASVGSISD